jgi:hypothetical protein
MLIILRVIIIAAIWILSFFWMGTKEGWNLRVSNHYYQFIFARLTIITIFVLVYILLKVWIDHVCRHNEKKVIYFLEALMFILMGLVFILIAMSPAR